MVFEGQQDTVVKPIQGPIRAVRGIVGATELGDRDPVLVLDVSATPEDRRTAFDTVRAVREQVALPLSIGGGVRTAGDAAALLDAGADVNRGRTDGATALHEAAETGQVDVIRILMERGAEVAAETDRGDTPAIAAARCGQLTALHCLAELGADLDHRNADGQTARSIVTEMVASLPAEKKR